MRLQLLAEHLVQLLGKHGLSVLAFDELHGDFALSEARHLGVFLVALQAAFHSGCVVLGGEGDGQFNAEVVEGSLGDVHGQVFWLPVSFLEDVRVEGLEPPRRSTRS